MVKQLHFKIHHTPSVQSSLSSLFRLAVISINLVAPESPYAITGFVTKCALSDYTSKELFEFKKINPYVITRHNLSGDNGFLF